MRIKSIARILMAATSIMMVCGLLASGPSAMAESHERHCSNRTLFGDYGFTVEGLLLEVPGVTLPPGATIQLCGVVLQHYAA